MWVAVTKRIIIVTYKKGRGYFILAADECLYTDKAKFILQETKLKLW